MRWPAASTLTATTLAGLAWLATSPDRRADFATGLTQLPWRPTVAVVLLAAFAVAHFVAAAAALRAVSDRRVGIRETAYAQLAAASVNRVVPNGIGALGINLRYLTRSGLPSGAAASSLAALAAVGAATDAMYVGGTTVVGPHVGVAGATAELHALTAAGVAAGQRHSWLLAGAVAIGLLVIAIRRRARPALPLRTSLRQAIAHAGSLLRQPRLLAHATVASVATTAVLSVAFVVAVHTWGSAAHALPVGALVALYWVAAAAGTATPLPSFLGVTEGALISGLTLGGYTASSATIAVLVFRGVTYWLPVPLGVLAARTLRRAQLL